MKNNKHVHDFFLLLIILFFLTASFFTIQRTEKPTIFITKQQSSFNLDESFWKYLNVGQKRLFSAILWIATILESDHSHYKGKDLNSWMFLRFKTISKLEPRFYENYRFGGQYLSIIKDDIEGASYIYKEALKMYPDDLYILKNASFHFYFEAQDYQLSYEVLKRLKKHPSVTPTMLITLARIESQQGNLEDALHILLDLYSSLKDKNNFLADKIWEQLYAIKAELDLNCLNTSSENCSVNDLKGNPYIKNNNIFSAQTNWTPYRIKKKK